MEITRTSSLGLYYRKDALWTQITTDWEQPEVLKIPFLKAEKKYYRSSNLNFII